MVAGLSVSRRYYFVISGFLSGVTLRLLVATDVSGQGYCLTLEDGADSLSRNVGN
jgi:hypothetical protein